MIYWEWVKYIWYADNDNALTSLSTYFAPSWCAEILSFVALSVLALRWINPLVMVFLR